MSLILSINLNNSKERSLSYFLIQTIRSIVFMLSLVIVFLFKTTHNPSRLFCISLFFKLALAPLHLWLIPISLLRAWKILFLLSRAQKILPLILLEIYRPEINLFAGMFCIFSIMSGTLNNLVSPSLKKILIFSRIANIGWVLIGLLRKYSLWKLFLIAYIFALIFIFLIKEKNSKIIKKINSTTFLCFLRIGGIPPLVGFFPKLIIMIANINISNKFILLMILFFTIIDLFIYTRLSIPLLFRKTTEQSWRKLNYSWLIVFTRLNVFLIGILI